ncbi:MAG: thioredoxin family protein [Candidatus Omnitrophica bacterium]|nr:thioredoxin family protein [Candidatus Omnitrophota bacterium]
MKKHIAILIISAFIQAFFAIAAFALVEVGSSRQEVVAAFGEPSGSMTSGNEEILSYPGGMIVIVDGKVDSLDKDFSQRLEIRKEENQFNTQQKEKGLVQHQGQWVTLDEKQSAESQKKLGQPIMVFNDGGAEITVDQILVPGKITIIDFYADWCPPCKKLSPFLEKLAKSDKDVYLRKVNIIKWGTPVTKQFSINSVPDVRVFDRYGRMVGRPTYDFNEILSNVQRSK